MENEEAFLKDAIDFTNVCPLTKVENRNTAIIVLSFIKEIYEYKPLQKR